MSKTPKDAKAAAKPAKDAKPEKGAKPEKDAKAEAGGKPEKGGKADKPKKEKIVVRRQKHSPSVGAMLVPVFLLALAAAFHFILNGMGPGHAETQPAETGMAGRASVVDADTLDLHGDRIRLVGVDAPEGGQKCLDARSQFVRCGTIAANALDRFIAQSPVTCEIEGKDRYSRLLGTCSVRGVDIQEWLVMNGHAMAYRTYSTAYVPAENSARGAKSGMWAGVFVMPWDWRKGKRLPGEKPTKAMLEGRV